jgi:hypothetical protein
MLDNVLVYWKRPKTYGPQLSSLLAYGSGDGGALHLTLGVDDLSTAIISI